MDEVEFTSEKLLPLSNAPTAGERPKTSMPSEERRPPYPDPLVATAAEMTAWLATEKTHWQWLEQMAANNPDADAATKQLREYWQTLATEIPKFNDAKLGPDRRKWCAEYIRDSLPLRSDTDRAALLDEIRKGPNGTQVAASAAGYFLGTRLNLVTSASVRGAFAAEFFERAIDPRRPEMAAQELRKIQSAAEEALRAANVSLEKTWKQQEQAEVVEQKRSETFEKQESSRRAAFGTELETMKAKWLQELTSIKSELEKYQQFVKTELALRAPALYWSTKQSDHGQNARIWGWAVSLGILAISFLLGWFVVRAEGQIDLHTIGGIVVVGVPLLWGLRLMVRNLISHLHLATDAAEREVMIRTFLAFLQEGNVGKEDRALILSAIFRSSATGFVKEEGEPSSLVDLLARQLHR